MGAADPGRARSGTDGRARLLPAPRSTATCSCTTRTTRSPRRSSSSSSRPPTTRTCSRSSRRSTAPPGRRARSSRSLIKAAEQGKQVVALVELKARFDEQANIERARVLEEAGVHVVYGLVGLKTHAKVLLVVRQEADGIRRYCHVGTGNYNPKTAHLYEDLGLLIGRPRPRRRPHRPVQPPHRLQPPGRRTGSCSSRPRTCGAALADRIERAGRARAPTGRIAMKMNSLVDPALIDALYDGVAARHARSTSSCAASAACARRCPGCPRTIRVRSIVGRFLEHSRIYRFGADPDDGRVPHRLRRPHAPQPRPPRRGARAGHRPAAARPARRDPRRSTSPTTCSRGSSPPTAPGTRSRRSSASPPTARSRSWRSLGRTAPDHRRGEHVVERARAQVHARSVVPAARRSTTSTSVRADAPETVRLDATYFDTADLRLARAGASLRFRNDEGWTVKLPGVEPTTLLDARRAARRRRAAATRPTEALDLVRALARERAARARRAARHRAPAASCCATATATQVGEVVDDEVSVLDGARLAARFRELEVELAEDGAARARATRVADRLRVAGAGRPDHDPEDRARARARARSTPPDLVAAADARLASTPLEVLRAAAIAASAARLIANDPGVRIGDDPEAVHQARVATRRLRSDLRTFRTRRRPRVERGAARRAEVARRRCSARCATPTCCSTGSRRASTSCRTPTATRASDCSTACASDRDARARRAARRACAPSATSRCSTELVDAAARAVPSSVDGDDLDELELERPRPQAVEASCASAVRRARRRSARRGAARGAHPREARAGTRPRRWRPRSGKRGQALRHGGRRRAGRARRAPGRGRRRAVAARRTRRTAADAPSARSSPASSPRSSDVAAATRRGRSGRRRGSSAKRAQAPAVDVSRDRDGRAPPAASCYRRSADGDGARCCSCTAPLRRLEPPQGQGRPRRARRGDRPARGRGGDGLALRARRTRRARPATATRKGATRSCSYWLMEPPTADGPDRSCPTTRSTRCAGAPCPRRPSCLTLRARPQAAAARARCPQ